MDTVNHTIALHRRPEGSIAREIAEIAEILTGEWFTDDVSQTVERDLLFHDLLCLELDGKIASFIILTSLDGCINIMLMGTRPEYRGQGLGTTLMQSLFEHAKSLGFHKVIALTVPPDTKPAYVPTVAFYKKNGFVVTNRYNELWQTGALELTRVL